VGSEDFYFRGRWESGEGKGLGYAGGGGIEYRVLAEQQGARSTIDSQGKSATGGGKGKKLREKAGHFA